MHSFASDPTFHWSISYRTLHHPNTNVDRERNFVSILLNSDLHHILSGFLQSCLFRCFQNFLPLNISHSLDISVFMQLIDIPRILLLVLAYKWLGYDGPLSHVSKLLLQEKLDFCIASDVFLFRLVLFYGACFFSFYLSGPPISFSETHPSVASFSGICSRTEKMWSTLLLSVVPLTYNFVLFKSGVRAGMFATTPVNIILLNCGVPALCCKSICLLKKTTSVESIQPTSIFRADISAIDEWQNQLKKPDFALLSLSPWLQWHQISSSRTNFLHLVRPSHK